MNEGLGLRGYFNGGEVEKNSQRYPATEGERSLHKVLLAVEDQKYIVTDVLESGNDLEFEDLGGGIDPDMKRKSHITSDRAKKPSCPQSSAPDDINIILYAKVSNL